ncbi:SGNH/GDSL hydrolase family protein [Litchfieldia alkalitelluris]|uniref:SGNH/GDSL hydrolase family protein n=1 Tax=Litchfieldia alkalitelluris TaxID=304268 RepID=UPI000996EE5D|nr:SGNH/GDSL hydrolase family protein [Litchfieldia alkalitelluris]
MKKLSLLIVIVLSIAAVILAKLQWDEKIAANGSSSVTSIKTETSGESAPAKEEKENDSEKASIMELTKNLDKEVAEKIEQAYDNGEPLHLVIFGSASSPEEGGWPSMFKEEIESTYGEGLINVTIMELADKSSSQVIEEELYKNVIGLNPDILLFESFILYDNSIIGREQRIENFKFLLDEFQSSESNPLVILQPSNPLLNAVIYPADVETAAEYAEEQSVLYLNHWDAWPDLNSQEMTDYVDNGIPTEKGHQLWADYLINYFIASEEDSE